MRVRERAAGSAGAQKEGGFTIIEVLVAVTLFAGISIGLYQMMISGIRGSETTRNVARISEEARLGFNRMIRDAREADSLDAASATSFTIWIDYDADNCRDYDATSCADSSGADEQVRYTYNPTAGTITLESLNSSGGVQSSAALIDGIEKVDGTVDVFQYTSNRLEYDWSPTPDGITKWQEIDNPPAGVNGVGDRDTELDSAELTFLSNIIIRFNVQFGDGTCVDPEGEGACTEFYGEAQLRNRRFSV